MGPAVGTAHATGTRNTLPFYCQTAPDIAEAQLRALAACTYARVTAGPEAGKVLLDTASAYQNGCTEETLGNIFAAHPDLRKQFSIHTKCNPKQLPWLSLSYDSVMGQANNSLKSLQIDAIDIFYLHSPDIETPIDDTLKAIEQLYKEKKIVEFGLSNYPAFKVVDIIYKCKARGIPPPTVYQGCYNAITRSIEFELAATCREFGLRMYHFNPLGGGILTGKYSGIDDQLKESGRFGPQSPISGEAYSQRYWKQQIFEAIEIIRKACEESKINMAAASLRWLMHHSILSAEHGDGIIFGASSLSHCEHNLKYCGEGPLPESVVKSFDQAWELSRFVSTPYFRGYSATPGGCDAFLAKHQKFVPKSAV